MSFPVRGAVDNPHRGRLIVVGALVLGAGIAACTSGTDPVAQGQVVQIVNITTSAHAASTDTIRVAFSYVTAPCDTGAALEVRDENGSDFAGMRFTARSHPVDQACALTPTAMHPVVYAIPPVHFAPMRLIFSEPDGNDTVRVVGP
jgi:hypothetical protein